MRLVYALLSTTVVYSSGPVTPLMQKRPSRRSEKNPSSIHSRAVSTTTSAPAQDEVQVARDVDVLAHGVRDVGVDVVLRRAGRVPGRGLLAADRPPRIERPAVTGLPRPRASGLEHPAPELQHPLGPLRGRVHEEGHDVDLRVPEVVTLIAVAGQALGRHPETLAARRGLHELEEVEAHRLLQVRGTLQQHVAARPELLHVAAMVELDHVVALARGVIERAVHPGDQVAVGRLERPVVSDVLASRSDSPGRRFASTTS